MRILSVLVATLSLPVVAHAAPVTWEARGEVESSTLDALFFETHMPELAGTTAHDALRLRITFDADAVGRDPVGHTRRFDATSLVMSLEVPGRGTHIFAIDPSVPPGSLIGIFDDQAVGDLVRDGMQFRHDYLTDGVLLFQVFAGFFTADTSVIDGLLLPLTPDPRLAVGVERLFSVKAQPGELGELTGIFTSLVRVPEPGSLALFAVGLGALGAVRRRVTIA